MSYENSILNFLHQRVSFPRLVSPAPEGEQLKGILKSALRAPDHKVLRPGRYLIVEGDARTKLGELFAQAAVAANPDCGEAKIEKCKKMPFRAPMILVAVSKNIDHPKVPYFEQEQCVAAGLSYILLALQAEGFGGMWRTGDMAVDSVVKRGLGISEHESLVGFLYIGTPEGEAKRIVDPVLEDSFSFWTGQ